MSKKGYSAEEIIRKLRQDEVLLGQGKSVDEICRVLCIFDSTYYNGAKIMVAWVLPKPNVKTLRAGSR